MRYVEAWRRAARADRRTRKPADLPRGTNPNRRSERRQSGQADYRDSPPSITRSIGRKPVGGAVGPLGCNRAMALLRLLSIAPGLMLAVAAWRHCAAAATTVAPPT